VVQGHQKPHLRMRLAVLGSPIAHSKSPVLHRAAYEVLGLDWEYTAIEVGAGGLGDFLAGCGPDWRGLSLTMPLKREALPLLAEVEPVAAQVGAVNTVLFRDGARIGFNTDIYGVQQALRELGAQNPDTVLLLGAGATASSVVAAVHGLGATRIVIGARTPAKAGAAIELATQLGVAASAHELHTAVEQAQSADVVISTLPGDAALGFELPTELRKWVPLFDVAYAPWPTAIARSWAAVDGTAASGLGMLLHQAVRQVRVFVTGDPEKPLDDEAAVLTAMRRAIGH
jgi:shikimate dehydrogenase